VIVRYNPVIGIILVVVSVINLGLAVVTGSVPVTISALIVGAMGVLYLRRPWFVLAPTGIVLKALIGPVTTNHPGPPEAFRMVGGRLVGPGDKTVAHKWMAHGDDWAALAKRLGS
jgi:hypothetical protein